MSFVARGSRRIPVAAEVAFDRLADHTSWFEWMPSSFRPVGKAVGVLRRGQKVRIKIAGIPVASPVEVSEMRRPTEIAWSGGVPGVLWANHQFFFEADGPAATVVVSHETWSGLLAPFVERFIKPQAERIGGQQLEALARSLG
jgi:hypothetical protein